MKMTESDFLLWIALVHTAPDYITSPADSLITTYPDYSWRNYCLEHNTVDLDEYWDWMIKYKLQLGMTTSEMIDLINKHEHD